MALGQQVVLKSIQVLFTGIYRVSDQFCTQRLYVVLGEIVVKVCPKQSEQHVEENVRPEKHLLLEFLAVLKPKELAT